MTDTTDTSNRSGDDAAALDRGRGDWVVRPRRASVLSLFSEMWDYRALIPFILVQSTLQVYRKAWLGIAWLFIRPALAVTMAVLVVGQLLGIATDPVPLLLFTVTGFALWTPFRGGMRHGTKSLTRGRILVRRVNVPRLMIVLGSLGPILIEFSVVFVGATVVAIVFSSLGIFTPDLGWPVLAALPAFLMVLLLTLGITCVTSVLNTIAVDFYFTLNYLTAGLFIVTPVAYPLSAVPEGWRWIIQLNPLTAAMETWRWALLGTPAPDAVTVALATVAIAVIVVIGLIFFLYYERAVLDRS